VSEGDDGPVGVVAEDVVVELGGTRVLETVSARAPAGSLVGLVGPNGAGKTTFLRTVNGTLSPAVGTVRVGEEPVEDLDRKALARQVATVPQDTAVGFDFDVHQVVTMGRYPHRPRFGTDPNPEAVDRAIDRVGVRHLANRSVSTVSGGERQRVLLARALAQDAPVLVLDEPTASLDVTHAVETLALVADLVADGRTAVVAIHDLDLAARFCDRLVLLAGGRIIARGPPREVLTESTVATAFGGDPAVVDHPITGAPTVTALADGDRRSPDRGVESPVDDD
jgi:iron complex transport system ATP-binding protein